MIRDKDCSSKQPDLLWGSHILLLDVHLGLSTGKDSWIAARRLPGNTKIKNARAMTPLFLMVVVLN